MEKIETRIPTGDAWVKCVTAVKATAKTGYDWEGQFLTSGRLEDLEPGIMVVTCDTGGSRKHPVKIVELHILLDDGGWIKVDSVKDNEWAYELRKMARAPGWRWTCRSVCGTPGSFTWSGWGRSWWNGKPTGLLCG